MLLITENMMIGSDCVILFQVAQREQKFTNTSLLFFFFLLKFVLNSLALWGTGFH